MYQFTPFFEGEDDDDQILKIVKVYPTCDRMQTIEHLCGMSPQSSSFELFKLDLDSNLYLDVDWDFLGVSHVSSQAKD